MLKPRTIRLTRSVLLAGVLSSIIWISAGDLYPPGPVSPTMKSLAQVEPRTPIIPINDGGAGNAVAGPGPGPVTCPGTISTSGAYYLTGNCTVPAFQDGIVINAANIELDLNGYAIIGDVNSGSGILANFANLAFTKVINGTIRNCGGWGIAGLFPFNTAEFRNLRILYNGGGIQASALTLNLTDCITVGNDHVGISVDSKAGGVRNCISENNRLSGVYSYMGVKHLHTAYNGGDGIELKWSQGYAPGASHSLALYNDGNGILMAHTTGVDKTQFNQCAFNGLEGIYVPSSESATHFRANNAIENGGFGIEIDSCVNLVYRNWTADNVSGHYSYTGGACNPFVGTPTAAVSTANYFANIEAY
jgi:hypothetical protein